MPNIFDAIKSFGEGVVSMVNGAGGAMKQVGKDLPGLPDEIHNIVKWGLIGGGVLAGVVAITAVICAFK